MDDSSSPPQAENKPPSSPKSSKTPKAPTPAQSKPAPSKTPKPKQGQRTKTGAPTVKKPAKPPTAAPTASATLSPSPIKEDAAEADGTAALDEALPPILPISEQDEAAPNEAESPAEPPSEESASLPEEALMADIPPSETEAAPEEAAGQEVVSIPEPALTESAVPPTEATATPQEAPPAEEPTTSSPPSGESEAAPAAEASTPAELPPESASPPADKTAAPLAERDAPALEEPSTESALPAQEEPSEPDESPPPRHRVATVFRRIGASIGIVGALLVAGGVFLPNYGSGDYEQAALHHAPYGPWIVVGLLLAPAFILLVSHVFTWFKRSPLWLVVFCCLLIILLVWIHWLVEALFVGLSCFDVCPPGGIHYGTGFWLPLIGFPVSGIGIIIAAIASIRWRSKRRARAT